MLPGAAQVHCAEWDSGGPVFFSETGHDPRLRIQLAAACPPPSDLHTTAPKCFLIGDHCTKGP